MGQGDVPTSRGGPLRRRREKRQLEQLAETSERDVPPRAAAAHVRVIEDQADAREPDPQSQESESPRESPLPSRLGGFHVRAVPIDEPFGE